MTDKAHLTELAKAADLAARLRQRAGWWSDSDPEPDAVMTDDEEADLYRAAADALDALLDKNARLAAGPYRYLCTKGHHVVSHTRNDIATCDAVVPWPGGEPCGAQLTRYAAEWRDDLADALEKNARLADALSEVLAARAADTWQGTPGMTEDEAIESFMQHSATTIQRIRAAEDAARVVLEQQESEQ